MLSHLGFLGEAGSMALLLLLAALGLAYANGANDNFKGVATLYGSSTLGYRSALALATVATLAGSACALVLANGLVDRFSGKGLVAPALIEQPAFLFAVGLGAALTVLLATRLGFPISTTHGLVGALVGAGWAGAASIEGSQLVQVFLLPLLVSPFLALLLGALLHPTARRVRQKLGWHPQSCVCIGEPRSYVPVASLTDGSIPLQEPVKSAALALSIGDPLDCQQRYTQRVLGVPLQGVLDLGHIASAATVSFTRGLHDTPKIAGLLVVARSLDLSWGLTGLALAMAMGGLLHTRRVAETMSHSITELSPGQGMTANLVTSLLVLGASRLGVPVSTTHVSVGSLFGIRAVSGKGDPTVVWKILASWLITLPLAAVLAALLMKITA